MKNWHECSYAYKSKAAILVVITSPPSPIPSYKLLISKPSHDKRTNDATRELGYASSNNRVRERVYHGSSVTLIKPCQTSPSPHGQTFLRNEPYLARVHVQAISVSQGDTLYVLPHWHDERDELFRIVKGRMEVLIGTHTKIYVPEDGEIMIPKGVVHSMRTFHDEETIFEERTEPMVCSTLPGPSSVRQSSILSLSFLNRVVLSRT